MLGLKLNHVSKRGHWGQDCVTIFHCHSIWPIDRPDLHPEANQHLSYKMCSHSVNQCILIFAYCAYNAITDVVYMSSRTSRNRYLGEAIQKAYLFFDNDMTKPSEAPNKHSLSGAFKWRRYIVHPGDCSARARQITFWMTTCAFLKSYDLDEMI